MRNLNENGRSMVEMLGVLAIIGVLSAGGLAGYSKAMFKHKLNSTVDQITMLATSIRTQYGAQGNYKGLDAVKAYNLGIIPEAMVETKTATGSKATAVTLRSPFKGSVTIATSDAKEVASGGTSQSTAFTLAYDKLPQEACVALATMDFGSGAGSGFVGVGVGSTAVWTAEYVGAAREGEAYRLNEVAGSTPKCVAGANNKVTWKFY